MEKKMFKSSRWRSEKNKIKAVFKLQFHATQVLVHFFWRKFWSKIRFLFTPFSWKLLLNALGLTM